MRGYWHITAISVVVSVLTIVYSHYFFLVAYFLWLFYLFYNQRLRKWPLLISLIFLLFFSFYIPTVEKIMSKGDDLSLDQNVFTGKVVKPPSISDKKIDFVLQEKATSHKYLMIFFPQEDVSISHKEQYAQFAYGANCKVTGKLEIPSESRNPGQFDFQQYLLKQGITHQIIIDTLADVQCEGSSLLNKVYFTRMGLLDLISERMNIDTTAWLTALVLGDDSQLDDEIIELFQRWGISHILAISGLHVGLMIGIVYFMLVKCGLVTKEKAQWIMIFFLPLYALIAGGQPSVWRACLMALLFIILNKVKLKLSVTDTLSIVFLLLVLFDKYIIYHVGFQLSFAVTFALVISRQLLANTTSWFFQVLQISFISQMAILPLQFTYFSTFQPLSMVLNVLVIPYFSLFVIPLMFFLLVVSPLPYFLIGMIDTLFIRIHKAFIIFMNFIDQVAYYPIFIGDFPIVLVTVYYVLLYMFMCELQQNQQIKALKNGIILIGLLIFMVCRPYFSSVGTVTMLDIGQGDAFVVELPYRKGVFFIDIGASFSFTDFKPSDKVYKQVIQPYLQSRGIMKIDAIFLSHEDIDHMGSVPYLLEDVKVDDIIISHHYVLSDEEESLWKEKDVNLIRIGPSENITMNGQVFQTLGITTDQVSENENSLVLYTELGGKRWLFTGDIGKETERKFIQIYDQLSIDVLKVAHHGSQTSTDLSFIEHIEPTHALISAGKNNSYGHPVAEVLETLTNQNVKILRTDESGAVQYHFKKNQGTFSRYLP